MRKFRVYLDHGYAGTDPEEEIVELPDDVTDKEIEDVCSEALENIIGNLNTGWYELDKKEATEKE